LISIQPATALAMCVEEELRRLFAIMRASAIQCDRHSELLCERISTPIVASWHVMRANIFGSDLVDPAVVTRGSIR